MQVRFYCLSPGKSPIKVSHQHRAEVFHCSKQLYKVKASSLFPQKRLRNLGLNRICYLTMHARYAAEICNSHQRRKYQSAVPFSVTRNNALTRTCFQEGVSYHFS
eukprot:TRINITY_DN9097_c2_g1_i1.p1 TRINITY_DN9097_c2_g1~~TRINITY_DN9097_c2_g1_i1.p1  ORF type:complete len:105 (+),score=5.59 TRINITY_DN9097_c2_g1_i1:280-594(+)